MFAKIIHILKKQRHAEGTAIFTNMDLLAFKYYVIELLPKIKQEVKYEEAEDFFETTRIAVKKEDNLEDTPRPILIKSPVVIQTPSIIVGRAMVVKQLEAPSQIEIVMEALVNQMSQFIVNLPQGRHLV